MRKHKVLILLAGTITTTGVLGQVLFDWPQVGPGTEYWARHRYSSQEGYNGQEHFFGLAGSFSAPGSFPVPWSSFASRVPGWAANQTSILVGLPTTPGLQSYGPYAGEKALGSLASEATGTIRYGWQLQNNTPYSMTQIAVRYTGEQWLANGDTTQYLYFSIGVGALNLEDNAKFIDVPSMNFASQVNGVAQYVDGYYAIAAHDEVIDLSTLGLEWKSGDTLWLRWSDIADQGLNHGLAIDDVQFSAGNPNINFSSVPEPSSYAMIACLGLVGFAGWRRMKVQQA